MKERYLIYMSIESRHEGIPEQPGKKLFSAEDLKTPYEEAADQGPKLVTKDDIEFSENPEDHGDVLTFGGENAKIAVNGKDVHSILSLDPNPEYATHVYIAINDKEAYPASWDGNKYKYTDGKLKGQPVKFWNNNKYEVSSDAVRRIAELEGESGQDKVLEMKAMRVEGNAKPESRYASLGGDVGGSAEAALALAAESAARLELAKYVRPGEDPDKVPMGFLRARKRQAEEDRATEKVEPENIKAALDNMKLLQELNDGFSAAKLADGTPALYYRLFGRTIVKGPEDRYLIYKADGTLSGSKTLREFKPATRAALAKAIPENKSNLG